jgi:O-succinylbenzoate synthase
MIDIKTAFLTLPYRAPVPVRGRVISENRFLKVTVLEKEYFISTLPHFHQSTLEEIAFKLKTFFANYALDFNHIDFGVKFFNLAPLDPFLKSIEGEILFNIEAILLEMIRTTHPHLFKHDPVKINQLYRPQLDLEIYASSECLKIKIAPGEVHKTIWVMGQLAKINPSIIYRLDGNRQFELEEMIIFLRALEKNISARIFSNIEYIEEPFKNFYDTFLFQKRSPIPIAMDESFEFYMNDETMRLPAVVKPSLLGISPVYSLLRFRQDQKIIISSSFEHPTILVSLESLARMRPLEFHGLENFFLIQ